MSEKKEMWKGVIIVAFAAIAASTFASWRHSESAGWFAFFLLGGVASVIVSVENRLSHIASRLAAIQESIAAKFGKEGEPCEEESQGISRRTGTRE